MKVEATKLGYYGHKRRPEGSVFTLEPITRMRPVSKEKGAKMKSVTISPEQQFSERWMKRVGEETPEKTIVTDKKIRSGSKIDN